MFDFRRIDLGTEKTLVSHAIGIAGAFLFLTPVALWWFPALRPDDETAGLVFYQIIISGLGALLLAGATALLRRGREERDLQVGSAASGQ